MKYILILLFGSFLFSCGESEEIERSPVKFDIKKLVTSMSSDVRQSEDVEQEILSKLSVTLNEAWSTPLIIENPYLEFPSKASYGKLKFDGVNLKLNKQYAYYKNNDMYMLQKADWVTEVGGFDGVRFTKKQNIPQIIAKWKSEDGLNNGSFLIKPILEGDFVNHFYYELSSDKWMVYGYEKEMSFEEFNEVVISLNSICGTNSVPKEITENAIEEDLASDDNQSQTESEHQFPGKYPEASLRELSKKYVSSFSKKELRIMRNEIFARHGRIFKSEDLCSYFNSQDWYHPTSSKVIHLLSDIEKVNVSLIKQYE